MNVNLLPTNGLPNYYDNINNSVAANPVMLVIVFVVIVIYYLIFSSATPTEVAASAGEASPLGSLIEVLMWGLFIFLLLVNGLKYFFEIDITTAIKNIFSPVPEVDITISKDVPEEPIPEITFEKQVFHIPNNVYTYDEAGALCKAYGARLAKYDEIENAYQSGGEWCGYGWSADQLALYPTQKKTYDKLQKIKGHEHDCGRTGINGGYIENPNVRFGVNCYGYKPEITPEERELMDEVSPFPLTEKEKKMERLVKKYRQELPSILVSPFNNKQWSQV